MENDDMTRIAGTAVVLGVAALVLSGCLGSPTYGTGTPATEQLLDDVSSAITIGGPKNPDIEYRPRPGLVTPPDDATLPPPQTSVAASEQWPESPEETRERLRAEAELGDGGDSPLAPNTGYSGIAPTVVGGAADGPPPPGSFNDDAARERYQQAQELARASNPTQRNFLSEPPVEYRQPAATAPVGDLGETERTKERRRERSARVESPRRWWPF